jgi:2-oxoglutarate ferredoxin oxidoreductase subunit alpha
VLLADEIIAHMRERIAVPPIEQITIVERKKPDATEKRFFGLKDVASMPAVGEGFNVPVTGSTHDEHGYRFTADPLVHRKLVVNLVEKIRSNAEKIIDFESYNVDNCDVGVVSFGCTSRAVYEAVEMAGKKGINVGFVRLKTIWPFPEKTVRSMAQTADVIVVPEMNLGEIRYEVERAAQGAARVVSLNKIGGGEMITPEELLTKIVRSVKAVD